MKASIVFFPVQVRLQLQMRSLLTFISLGKVELKVAIPVLSCDLSHQERPTKGKYFPLINKGLLVGVINLGKEILLTDFRTFP